jgi:hypothetical protein
MQYSLLQHKITCDYYVDILVNSEVSSHANICTQQNFFLIKSIRKIWSDMILQLVNTVALNYLKFNYRTVNEKQN